MEGDGLVSARRSSSGGSEGGEGVARGCSRAGAGESRDGMGEGGSSPRGGLSTLLIA